MKWSLIYEWNQGRLVNDTEAVEPLNFIQSADSCASDHDWDEDLATCFPKGRTGQYLFSLGIAFFSLQAFATTCALSWTAWNKKSTVVIASQPEFLSLVAIVSLLLASAILPLSIEGKYMFEPDAEEVFVACMAVPWLLCIGLVLIYSALLGKLLRIKEIMDNAELFQIVEVRRTKVVKIIVSFLSGIFAILVVWQIVSPLRWEVNDSVGQCTSNHSRTFLASCAIYIGVCLGYALVLSWKSRNMKSQFQESLYIALSVFYLLQLLMTGVPIMVIARSSVAYTTVFSLVIFSMSIGVTLLIFVPKVAARHGPPETQAANRTRESNASESSVEAMRRRVAQQSETH